MPKDQKQDSVENQLPAKTGTALPRGDEFLSLREILAMILRHRRFVLIFVLLVTLAGGVFFGTRPRIYQAEGYLQVIPPVSLEGRVDKDQFETMIVSHLQRVSSAFIAKNTVGALKDTGLDLTPIQLGQMIKITRPPKTDLIRLAVKNQSQDSALLIVRSWILQYLASVRDNNIRTALPQVRSRLKLARENLIEKQAMVDKLKTQLQLTEPLVTLSRAVDDRQLWHDLTQKLPEPEALKKLAEIHIKGQEQSTDYINLRLVVNNAEQLLASAQARRDLFQDVEQLLEGKLARNGAALAAAEPSTNKVSADAVVYVKMVLNNVEIIQFGEPGLVSSEHGFLKKTGLVFFGALVLACFCAFLYEWGKNLPEVR
jgi:hypothetical protein